MTSYLLLRSNKESGPYNLEDLVKMGLKPYDLIWVQGKSAAWRYPSEIEELKPYSSVTEEQPYDRFYKKNTDQEPARQELDAIETPEPDKTPSNPIVEERPVIEEKYRKYIPKEKEEKQAVKRSVFVTMPEQPVANPEKASHHEPSVPVSSAPPATITVSENPATQVKYSQPLDEIKEMYVKALQERKNKIARKGFLLTNLKRAAVVTGLVALGILGGFAIKSASDNGEPMVASRFIEKTTNPGLSISNNNPAADPATSIQKENRSIENNTPPVDEDNSTTEQINLSPVVKEKLMRQQQVVPDKRKEAMVTPPSEKELFDEGRATENIQKDPQTGERSRRVRNETTEDIASTYEKPVTKNRKNALANFVSVKSNDYKRVAFGGIRNLELTVINDSKYFLDKVTVELQYLKPSEEPLKTELIQFHSIQPNGSLTMRVRDTNRGIKVLFHIVNIESQRTETAFQD